MITIVVTCPLCKKKCNAEISYEQYWGGLVESEIKYSCKKCSELYWAYGKYEKLPKLRWYSIIRKRRLKKLLRENKNER